MCIEFREERLDRRRFAGPLVDGAEGSGAAGALEAGADGLGPAREPALQPPAAGRAC